MASSTSVESACPICGVNHNENEDHAFIMAEDSVDEDFLDPVSLAPVFDGVHFPTTDCRHTFSRFTIKRCLRLKNECPVCRTSITMSDMKPVSLMVSNILDKLRVLCPYDPTATHGTFKRGELSQHLRVCESGPVLCPLEFEGERCEQQMCRSELAGHMAACALRVVNCPLGCEGTLRARDQASHNCLQYLRMMLAKQSELLQERTARLESTTCALSATQAELADVKRMLLRFQNTPSALAAITTMELQDGAHQQRGGPGGVYAFGPWRFALCRQVDDTCDFERPTSVVFFWAVREGHVFSLSFILASNGWFNISCPSVPYRCIYSGNSRENELFSSQYLPPAFAALPAAAAIADTSALRVGNWHISFIFEPHMHIVVNNTQNTDNIRVVLHCDARCSVVFEPYDSDPFAP